MYTPDAKLINPAVAMARKKEEQNALAAFINLSCVLTWQGSPASQHLFKYCTT